MANGAPTPESDNRMNTSTEEPLSIHPRHVVDVVDVVESRLIERAFPLKQTSLDSVREKYGPRGHISGFHLWPARRPLAACRAALIATLLPDPGTPEERKALCEKIGGKLVKKLERKKMPDGSIVEREKEDTEGGILQWKRETENIADVDWFRQEIRKAYGDRAPKVLDPFAGGGAIPFEAMRLGCEATAVDINPVAWFILKCTLEYPQKLAGKTHPLPDFILENEEFMNTFYKAHPYLVGRTKKTKKQAADEHGMFPMMVKEDSGRAPKADLAWHVRAWGKWVLERARRELAQFYPTYAEFETIKLTAKDVGAAKPYEKRPMQLVPIKDDGTLDVDAMNKDFSEEYLDDKKNPRWVAKPTVAYLWARTVKCKNCRATIPLLKTRWLCKRDRKRVLFTIAPNVDATGVVFAIETNVPARGGNAAQRREHDKKISAGTVSPSGAKCPCCGTIMATEDIRLEGQSGRLGAIPTVVVAEGHNGKLYRLPTKSEREIATECGAHLQRVFGSVPYGPLNEATPSGGGSGASRAFSVQNYGILTWQQLFTQRQLLALGTLVNAIDEASKACHACGASAIWGESIHAYLACSLDRLVDQLTTVATWYIQGENVKHTYVRFALPVMWDYAEANPLFDGGGSWSSAVLNCTAALDHALRSVTSAPPPHLLRESSTQLKLPDAVDLVVTDPPYYDAIPYSDLMDLFYIWLRRSLHHAGKAYAFMEDLELSPKWDREKGDGELIDDESRHEGDAKQSKCLYEDGMFRVFQSCFDHLKADGRLVVVFAHKQPDAWETLAYALIRAGFVVNASWPIQTENVTRSRARGSAALASSLWLVCHKRPATARPGWDNQVLDEMRQNISERLREYWDAGIRGPDFVWAATGPAMEAYSKHPVVKKANEPGPMTVSEFLTHVRRIVVDFVVGRVLSGDKEGDADSAAADRLDEPTAYYLLHRHDFGMDEAPAGACILYAVSCGISDRELAQTWDLIGFTKGKGKDDEDEEADADAEADPETEEDSGSKVKLKTWAQRKGKSLGYEAPGGKPVPLIDRVHCLMHLWKAGDLSKVDGYLDGNGLRRHELFKRLLQSLIELSPHGSEERSLMESISNHVGARGAVKQQEPELFTTDGTERTEEG